MTVLEAIDKSRQFLESKGIESARLESEWILGQVLDLPRLQLYLNFDRNLSEAETVELREKIKRRGAREPLQHILGTAEFCGLEIAVNKNVLIPRPETEMLAEAGWQFLNSSNRPTTFLDFGAGSGCISVAICHRAPGSRGVAVDISKSALEVASTNVAAQDLGNRISMLESDGFTALPPQRFDLIVSNPPYIPAGEIRHLQPEVRDFDPSSALDGGEDGLDFYRLLAREAPSYLAAGGRLMCEFGDGQAEAIAEIMRLEDWTVLEIREDFSARPRFIILERRT